MVSSKYIIFHYDLLSGPVTFLCATCVTRVKCQDRQHCLFLMLCELYGECQICFCMTVVSTFRRLGQDNFHKFKATTFNIVKPCLKTNKKGRCTGKDFREIVLQITKIMVRNYLYIIHFSKKQFNIIIVKHVRKTVNKMSEYS